MGSITVCVLGLCRDRPSTDALAVEIFARLELERALAVLRPPSRTCDPSDRAKATSQFEPVSSTAIFSLADDERRRRAVSIWLNAIITSRPRKVEIRPPLMFGSALTRSGDRADWPLFLAPAKRESLSAFQYSTPHPRTVPSPDCRASGRRGADAAILARAFASVIARSISSRLMCATGTNRLAVVGAEIDDVAIVRAGIGVGEPGVGDMALPVKSPSSDRAQSNVDALIVEHLEPFRRVIAAGHQPILDSLRAPGVNNASRSSCSSSIHQACRAGSANQAREFLPSISRFSMPSSSVSIRIARSRHCGLEEARPNILSGSMTCPSASTTTPLRHSTLLKTLRARGTGWRNATSSDFPPLDLMCHIAGEEAEMVTAQQTPAVAVETIAPEATTPLPAIALTDFRALVETLGGDPSALLTDAGIDVWDLLARRQHSAAGNGAAARQLRDAPRLPRFCHAPGGTTAGAANDSAV